MNFKAGDKVTIPNDLGWTEGSEYRGTFTIKKVTLSGKGEQQIWIDGRNEFGAFGWFKPEWLVRAPEPSPIEAVATVLQELNDGITVALEKLLDIAKKLV